MVNTTMNNKTYPHRMCIGCREMKEKKQLIRIVKNKEAQVAFDESGKLQGRGAYVCKSRECIEKARKNKGFERAFKSPLPDEIISRLSEEMKSLETK